MRQIKQQPQAATSLPLEGTLPAGPEKNTPLLTNENIFVMAKTALSRVNVDEALEFIRAKAEAHKASKIV